jgi:hypothetical protein
MKKLLLAATITFAACSSASADTSTDDEEIVTSRCEREYGAKIRAKIETAKDKLRAKGTPYATNVIEALDSGRVKALPMCKMTRLEFDELDKTEDLSSFGATPDEQYRALRRAEAPAMRTVHALIYGFQWENRIYLSTGMSDARMAETLAHEVRHVERAAHARNYDDQRVTCVEETAAFEAEIEVNRALTDADRKEIAAKVRDLYELDKLRPDTCTYR